METLKKVSAHMYYTRNMEKMWNITCQNANIVI